MTVKRDKSNEPMLDPFVPLFCYVQTMHTVR